MNICPKANSVACACDDEYIVLVQTLQLPYKPLVLQPYAEDVSHGDHKERQEHSDLHRITWCEDQTCDEQHRRELAEATRTEINGLE